MLEAIWQPLSIKNLTLPNRIVYPPIATETANDLGHPTEKTFANYQKMAASQVGLLIVEHHYISKLGQLSPGQLSISQDSDIDGEKKLVEVIHQSGVICALQINHAGSGRLPSMGEDSVGVSAVQNTSSKRIPEELSTVGIAEIITSFGNAAKRAKMAGYDLVEIHSAHGYLSSQFLSPVTNHRKDQYGGSIQNRMRFLLEVVEEVKGRVGEDYPLMVRLGVSDNPPDTILYPQGLTIQEGLAVSKELARQKVDILDISGGLCGSRPAGVNGEAYYLAFSKFLKPNLTIPTIYTAGVTSLGTAEKILGDQDADLVGIGRKLIISPDLIIKEKKR
jgi:NADPH2 dehydrogenase